MPVSGTGRGLRGHRQAKAPVGATPGAPTGTSKTTPTTRLGQRPAFAGDREDFEQHGDQPVHASKVRISIPLGEPSVAPHAFPPPWRRMLMWKCKSRDTGAGRPGRERSTRRARPVELTGLEALD